MTDPQLREDTAAAFVQLAQANLNAAIMLTEWPERHRLKQLTGDLAGVRDVHEEHIETLEAAKPCDDCAKRDAYAAREAEQREAAEPDPLDEDDHRDRVLSDGRLIERLSVGCWHRPGFEGPSPARCHRTLAYWEDDSGPLTFAPEPPPDATGDDPSASQPEPDHEVGDDANDAPEALLCPECGHDVSAHDQQGCYHGKHVPCGCTRTAEDIARALIAEAVKAERLRLAADLRDGPLMECDIDGRVALELARQWEQQ